MTDEVASDLAKWLGPSCAEQVLARCGLLLLMRDSREESSDLLTQAYEITQQKGSEKREALLEVAEHASSLADLLRNPFVQLSLVVPSHEHIEALTAAGKDSPSLSDPLGVWEPFIEQLESLARKARYCAEAVNVRNGPARDLVHWSVVLTVGRVMQDHGHTLSDADKSTFVRVLRRLWPVLHLRGNPKNAPREYATAAMRELPPREQPLKPREWWGGELPN